MDLRILHLSHSGMQNSTLKDRYINENEWLYYPMCKMVGNTETQHGNIYA